tara:strand:- start:542 stop:1117 length:576 start_codon:yes stop_codon:yes gene_type:complete
MAIITKDTPIGTELPVFARRFRNEMFATGDAKTIHNDNVAAQREGLPRAVAVGPQVAALIFRMMRTCFEEGWIAGGKAALTFRKPVWSNDFATAHGLITDREVEGGKVRVTCNVWIERSDGEKAIVGTCSALVPGGYGPQEGRSKFRLADDVVSGKLSSGQLKELYGCDASELPMDGGYIVDSEGRLQENY